MAELYVSDAFGTVHRAHASTAGVAAFLPAVSGLLVARELEVMGGALDDPKRPFVAVLGGAKVSDKINVINNLLDKADTVIIGGGIVGVHAGELIAEIALAIEMGCEVEDIGHTIHPHPTLSESVGMAAEVYDGTITDLYIPKKK